MAMKDNLDKVAEILRLQFKKGDLIIKEGDYGVSIYKILKGSVRITAQAGEGEVALATLGPGEVIGEMSFLSGKGERRSASARALEDLEMEVWHPARLAKEYEQMPAILKYITNQALVRLLKMNKVMSRLSATRQAREQTRKPMEPRDSQRLYYRKDIDQACTYRPITSSPKLCLAGRVKDLSFTGVAITVGAKNALKFPHELGDEFHISTALPNGKELDVTAKIINVRRDDKPGMLLMGMSFTNMSEEAKKTVGFFLLP